MAANINFIQKSAAPPSKSRNVTRINPVPVIHHSQATSRVSQPQTIALEGVYDPLALLRESIENRVRFEQKYTNKILTIRGKVSSVIPPQIARDKLGITVSVKSATEERSLGLPKVIYCNGLLPETAATLNRNDLLTVQGTYRGKSAINTIHLKECEVVAR